MATRLPVDWSTIKALYYEQVPLVAICQQTGCTLGALRQRIRRESWLQERQRVVKLTEQALDGRKRVSLVDRAKATLATLYEDAEETAELARKFKQPKNFRSLESKERALGHLVKRIQACSGLNTADGAQTIVNIDKLAIISEVVSETVSTSPPPEVVDVDSQDVTS